MILCLAGVSGHLNDYVWQKAQQMITTFAGLVKFDDTNFLMVKSKTVL